MKPKNCSLCANPFYRGQRLLMNPQSLTENCECTCIDKPICHRCFEKINPFTNPDNSDIIYQCPYCRNNINRFIIKFFKNIVYHDPSDTYITLANLMFLEQIPLYRIKKIESKIFESLCGPLTMKSICCMDHFSENECQLLDFYFPLVHNFSKIDSKITLGMFIKNFPKMRPVFYQIHRQFYLSNKMLMKLQFQKNAATETQISVMRRTSHLYDSDTE